LKKWDEYRAKNDGRHQMKKVKIILWLIIFGFFGLLLFQNQALFFQQLGMEIDLYVIDKIIIPDQFLAVFFLCFFLTGLLISYFFSLYSKFKFSQTAKGLNQKISSFMETISKLEAENESLKSTIAEKSRSPLDLMENRMPEEPNEEEGARTADIPETKETES
jgi:hypothetical protein